MNIKFLYCRNLVLVAAAAFSGFSYAQSQEIDSMQPATPPPPATYTEPEVGDLSTKPTEPVGSPAATTEGTQTAAPAVRSEISKKIDNKLVLGTSLGWVSLSGEGGNWNAAFHGQIFLAYALGINLVGFELGATARYVAMDVTPRIDKNSYRGVVEGYSFGAEGRKVLNESWTAVAGADLGYFITSLDSSDDLPKVAAHEENGISLAVGGGADWAWSEKIKLGPRARLGVGGFSTFEISGALSCYF